MRAAKTLWAADPSLAGIVLYHCQQTAEKALKALLLWHGQPIRKTHSIEEIGQQVLVLAADLAAVIADAVPLSA